MKAMEDYPQFSSLSRDELVEKIKNARLSKLDKRIIFLRLVDRMYYSDISAILGIHRTTVKRRLSHAVMEIRTP